MSASGAAKKIGVVTDGSTRVMFLVDTILVKECTVVVVYTDWRYCQNHSENERWSEKSRTPKKESRKNILTENLTTFKEHIKL